MINEITFDKFKIKYFGNNCNPDTNLLLKFFMIKYGSRGIRECLNSIFNQIIQKLIKKYSNQELKITLLNGNLKALNCF